jgi:hypothetical protein
LTISVPENRPAMNDLVSYLLAQAQRRPLATARFAASEALRRSRLRRVDGLDAGIPPASTAEILSRLRLFLPGESFCADEVLRFTAVAASAARAEAERICRNEFDIFGRQVSFEKEIDWHADWQANHRWPLEPAAGLRIVDAAPGADVKRPWELARFHHALTLGQAFFLTGEEKFAAAFAAQARHWIRHNPFPRGIHWAMPMEAAIRAVNWLHAAALVTAGENPLDLPFCGELWRALFLHGRFVYAHREWNPVARGNHYLACVVGLLHLGALFAPHPEGARWLAFARRELLREMRAQVGRDGAAHEGSSGYHAILAELFLTAALLLVRLDARLEEGHTPPTKAAIQKSCGHVFTERLEKMFDFLAALAACRAQPPIWGDADDGRLLPFCSADAAAAHHLLAVGAEVFERSDWPVPHACEEVCWRLGRRPRASEPAARSDAASAAFRHAGFFFFSSSRLRGSVRCGPLGVGGWANHAHCDQLSVEFCWDGQPFLADPGTYAYSGDAAARNWFRSTRAHNSPVVNGKEQNRFWPGLLFRMMDDTRGRPRAWRVTPQHVEFHGEHFGYRRLRQRVKVARGVRLDRQRHALEIFDYLTGSGPAQLEWHFQLAPDLQPESVPLEPQPPSSREPWGASVMVKGATPEMSPRAAWRVGPLRLRISTGGAAEEFSSAVEPGWVSRRYGQREAAPALVVRCRARFPFIAEFLFAPVEASS